MTVVRPNSISGINSITVASGEALSIHGADGALVSTLTNTSGIATYRGIHVGSGTTTADQGVIIGTGCSIVSDAVNTLDVYTAASKRLTIDSGGQVQINTDGSQTASNISVGAGADLKLYHDGSDSYIRNISNTDLRIQNIGNAGIEIHNQNSYPITFNTNGTERARIDSSGRVGINTATLTTANAGFDDLVIRSSAGGNTGLTLLSSTTTQGTIAFADGGSSTEPYRGYVQYNHSGDTMMFGLNGADKIRLGSSGEIGVAGAGSLNNGSSGQVLTSGGDSAGCTWQDAGGGIDDSCQWRLTSSLQGNQTPLTGWELVDTYNGGGFGSAMSESSGIFTFPSTGWWLITFCLVGYSDNSTQNLIAQIMTTPDNSTYNHTALSLNGIYDFSNSYPSWATSTAQALFDVTSTTNCKCRFDYGAGQGGEYAKGSGSYSYTNVIFTRLGDT